MAGTGDLRTPIALLALDETADRAAVALAGRSRRDALVALTVARTTGPAGRKGDSTGIHVCRDLACSFHVRGNLVSGAASLRETLPVEASVERLRRNLDEFAARVLAG